MKQQFHEPFQTTQNARLLLWRQVRAYIFLATLILFFYKLIECILICTFQYKWFFLNAEYCPMQIFQTSMINVRYLADCEIINNKWMKETKVKDWDRVGETRMGNSSKLQRILTESWNLTTGKSARDRNVYNPCTDIHGHRIPFALSNKLQPRGIREMFINPRLKSSLPDVHPGGLDKNLTVLSWIKRRSLLNAVIPQDFGGPVTLIGISRCKSYGEIDTLR